MKLLRRALLLALVLTLPATAQAATPVLLGNGVEPTVALDPSGTAYIAWIGNESNITTLHFCRLPRNATTCELTQTLPVDGTSGSGPVLTGGGSPGPPFTHPFGGPTRA